MEKGQTECTSLTYCGTGANDCFGLGIISFHSSASLFESGRDFLGEEAEAERFLNARRMAAEGFSELRRVSGEVISVEEAEIFEIYRDIALDEDLHDGVMSLIKEGRNAEASVLLTSERIAERLLMLDDEYLRDRAADIRNVGKEILMKLSEQNDEKSEIEGDIHANEKRIIVADDLSPADTIRLDRGKIAGFVLYSGSKSSHTAILASSLGIPCLTGCERLPQKLEGAFAILDAGEGRLTVNPSIRLMREYAERSLRLEEEKRRLAELMLIQPKSVGGRKLDVYANIGSGEELLNPMVDAAGGCGLFRSEFLFLGRSEPPSEEEQYTVYKKLFSRFSSRISVIRVLDIGADKIPSYIRLKHEENPALGIRGIRFLLGEKQIFKTQLRAILRASPYGRPAIMLPMICAEGEILEAKAIMSEVKEELRGEGEIFREDIPLGIMIETPASAIMARELACHSDFFSVGTNDLCQYTLAADRQNPALSPLIEAGLEAVLRLIEPAAKAIHEAGGWIGVCGELAGSPTLTERFLDMGIDEISVSLPYILKAKENIINAK